MSTTQMTLSGEVKRDGPGAATHGVCCLLERMSVEEFDAVLAGEIDVDELYARYGVER